MTLYLLKRNLHFLGLPLLIHGGSTCLFVRQTRVHDAMLLPETFYSLILEKDVYYNRK